MEAIALSNYLSYQVEGGSFVTVRWEKPMQKTTDCSGIKSEVAADLKLNSIESRLLESFQSNFCTINLSGET